MRLCIVGIGGAGGKVTKEFLQNVDFNSDFLSKLTNSRHVSSGRVEGIYLESAYKDAAEQTLFKDFRNGGYPGFYIPQDEIPDGSEIQKIVQEKYGYSVKKQGFVRDAQFLKAIFEIFDTDKEIQQMIRPGMTNSEEHINPIFDGAWSAIRTYTILNDPKGSSEGVLFIVSFGGGTGTGFINPIIKHIKGKGKGAFPVFVLGILTEPGWSEREGQKTEEGRRYLAAISAIYDLLTKPPGADGIILMDNEILMERLGSDNYSVLNRFIYSSMKPLVVDRYYPEEKPDGQAMQTVLRSKINFPPIFVPLFWSQPHHENPEEELVINALSKGKLFGCSPDKADKAIVYCRGFIDSEKIKDFLALHAKIEKGDIWVLRKIGEGKDEILILLRNPYGKDKDAYSRPGTFEYKMSKVIDSALRYIGSNEDELFYRGKVKEGEETPATLKRESIQAVGEYFFGLGYPNKETYGKTEGLVFELAKALKRLEAGKYNGSTEPVEPFDPYQGDPLFRKELNIFKSKDEKPQKYEAEVKKTDKNIEDRLRKIEEFLKINTIQS